MANIKIIDQIKRSKGDDGSGVTYDTFMLGPQLKYVSSLGTSNNNNLEEMLLLGTDRVIERWTDVDGTERERIEYRKDNDTNGFYILDIFKYSSTHSQDNVTIGDNNNIIFNGLNYTYNSSTTALELPQDSSMIYNPATRSFEIAPVVISENYKLDYKKLDGTIVHVSEKSITNYIDVNNHIIVKEEITNLLS